MADAPRIPILSGISELDTTHRAWLVDVWGVMHNGVSAFGEAVNACARFRASGGFVVLLTNAPRPAPSVVTQLTKLGVMPAAYDAVLTSGDVTRGLISAWQHLKLFHIGPERDLPLFADLVETFASEDEAEVIVCTGLFDDDREMPDDYRDRFQAFKARNAAMLCANPDLKVERGERIVPCAGAMAAAYEAIGGDVVYAGKPHGPIYEVARDVIKRGVGEDVADGDILCIGDGVLTDIKGASDAGLQSVYIASAIHLAPGAMTEDAVAETFQDFAKPPIAALRALA